MLTPIKSVTHAHLVNVLAQELENEDVSTANLVDIGCGNGQLMLACYRHLHKLTSRKLFISGFDVTDSRVQRSNFFGETLTLLQREAPDVPWVERLFKISSQDAWPYADSSVDAAMSNQVLEHVVDLDRFIEELSRVLKPGGIAINLFPLKSLLVESHVGVPFAHRIASDDVRRAYLSGIAKARLSKIGPMRISGGLSPAAFGRTRSEYLATQTTYRSFRTLAATAHAHGLTASYRWTPQFYLLKLGYLCGRNFSNIYNRSRGSLLLEGLTFPVLRLLSSVTVVFEKDSSYDPDDATAGHL